MVHSPQAAHTHREAETAVVAVPDVRSELLKLEYRNWSGPGDPYPKGGYLLTGGLLTRVLDALDRGAA